MANRTADAVVIGAGVIGCSVTYALAKAGWRVVTLDRNGAPGMGSTSGSSAIIRFNYSTYAGVLTSWESHFSWLDWQAHLGGPDDDGRVAAFVPTGSVCLEAPGRDSAKVLALFDRVGVPYERWDAATVHARVPALDPASHYPPKPVDSDAFWAEPDGEVGGYFTPDAGFVDDPSFAAHNLATAARRHGAEFVFKATVTAIITASGRVGGVELADGTRIEAPVVVNVGGPASGKINALAGVGGDFVVGTRPLRTEVHQVPSPSGYNDAPLVAGGTVGPLVADLDLGTYFRPTMSGELIIGGTEPECDPMEWLDDADVYAQGVTDEVYRAQVYRAARRMPELTVPNRPKGIAAVYDAADDWIPIYDRTSLPGFYVAMGTSGNQFKNSPLVGGYLRAIVEACENGTDHDVTPVSVTLPHTGLTLDLSAYSRRRQVTTDSSFSVMG
jgi:sarcosine oxidase, subunit beta